MLKIELNCFVAPCVVAVKDCWLKFEEPVWHIDKLLEQDNFPVLFLVQVPSSEFFEV